MADSAYGTPLLRRKDGETVQLSRVSFLKKAIEHDYDEAFIRDLVFEEPRCLPIAEIDRAYEQLVPICKELNTSSGMIDALYATPTGRLVILEAKLWRNPEARRKVVAQVLDYAKAISSWNYEDLQREVSRRLGERGNAIYQRVADAYPGVDEAEFVDEVQKSLRLGRIHLLIVGDGIREGAGGIAQFLEGYASLNFTFGLVELAIYEAGNMGLLIQPRTIARTVDITRSVVELEKGLVLRSEESGSEPQAAGADPELTDSQRFYLAFWQELLSGLQLDDTSQPIANPTRTGNIFFAMPPSMATGWLTVYFYKATMHSGVFLTFKRGNYGDLVYERLLRERDAIDAELGVDVDWQSVDGKHTITLRRKYDDLYADRNRDGLKSFLSDAINRMVNVFRPRLESIAQEIGAA